MRIIEEILFRILNRWGFRFWVMSPVRFYNSSCGKFVYRPFVEFLAEYYGEKKISGAEIGVFRGDFSRVLLRRLNLRWLFLIDPYLRYEGYNDVLSANLETEDFSKIKVIAHKKLKEYKNIIYAEYTSETAVRIFKKESLDFVYIDANHDYEYIKQDMEMWWGKVKKGGVLGGHDMDASFLGVCKAVIEFCNKKKLILYGKQREWWIIKK